MLNPAVLAKCATSPQRCVYATTIIVELTRSHPHYAQVYQRDSGAWAESAPEVSGKGRVRGEMFITPSHWGTLHVQARCMKSSVKVWPHKDSFHEGSRPYATLAQVLHGVSDPRAHQGWRGITLLPNGAASAVR
jgi:hypothetical protein